MTEPWSTSYHHTIMATRMHMPPSIMHLPNMPWIRHTMHISNPTNQPPSPRTQTLKCQYINLSIIMTKFPLKLPSQLVTYTTLQSLLTRLGWTIPPPTIITVGMRGTIGTTKELQGLHIPITKIHKLTETFIYIAIKYLIHIILDKRKL